MKTPKKKNIFSGTFSFQISLSVLGSATNSALAAAPTQLLQGWQNLQPVVLAAAAQTALKITARLTMLTMFMYIRAQNFFSPRIISMWGTFRLAKLSPFIHHE